MRYDYYANQVEFHAAGEGHAEVRRFDDFERNQMFVSELQHYLDCLKGKASPAVSLRDGRKSLQIGLASARSMEEGAVVSVTN